MSDAATNIENEQQHFDFEIDAGIAERAAIGLLVLSSDQTVEHDFRRMLNLDGVGVFQSRLETENIVTPESLKAMEARIPGATELVLPGVDLDVVAYGCTSASMVIGEQRIFEQIHSVRPGVACTTPITGAFAAFDTLGIKRLAVLTPYRTDVNQKVRDYIEGRGVEVTAFGSFHEQDDRRAARITEQSIADAAIALGQSDDVDGIFVSCTSLRLASAAQKIEQKLGKPVTSSNHAMAWHCLRLAGINDPQPEHGKLFELPLAC